MVRGSQTEGYQVDHFDREWFQIAVVMFLRGASHQQVPHRETNLIIYC